MKKLIILAAVFGLTAAISAYADDATNNGTADLSATNNWASLCAKCHGDDGKGQTKMGQRLGCRDYTDVKVQASIKDDEAFKSIKEGLKNSDGKSLMKPYDMLTDDQIKALVDYMHTFKK
jgi:cytochrome c553